MTKPNEPSITRARPRPSLAELAAPPVADWARKPMYEGTRGSTQGERKEVAPAATARGIVTFAKFKLGPSLADLLASVTGASGRSRNERAPEGVNWL